MTALRLPVNAVLQPVGRDIGVNVRVIRDHRKIEEEKQSQNQPGESSPQKENSMFADQPKHVANISRIAA